MRPIRVLVALALLTAGCAQAPDTAPSTSTPPASSTPSATPSPSPSPSASPSPSPAEQPDITIAHFAFSPASYPEEVGGTVSWQNLDTVTHTVTADDGSFDSGPIAPGATYTHAFATAGVVAYHCKIHGSMHGSLTIGNVTNETPTPSSTPPSPTPTPSPSSTTPPASSTPASSTPASPTPASPPPDQTVMIQGFAYAPETLTVPAGTTVIWHDLDAAPHGAAADDGTWTTGVVASGASGSHTFTTPGTWTYHCPVHGQSMTGKIVVT